ncbi:mechanosensitive ion channel [Kineosporia sp. J2-2]|uniref:Mechanosensitive ion channel n=1 Tax=Kineosporia corallincola TaxID=2835133 RepID=A0ABS5TPK2_9ACTN|nr:mechanosensitive ion channel domain-containing protein [Kineosporia corallincola]MBT0773030.1 mechanosensitive ion channel [Kineosporia corallincola]
MDLDFWTRLLIVAAVTVAAGLIAWSLTWLAVRIGRRHDSGGMIAIHRLCRHPFVLTVAAIALEVTLQAIPGIGGGWTRAAGIAVILSACWLIVRSLLVGEEILFWRLRMDVAQNRRIRRLRTQITLVRRVLGVVVVLVGVAAVLMSIPQMRTFGASLLASAGIAGILAGLAAQTTLGNMFAGLQLAFTDAVRIDDVVVIEDEWGWIEEITLTYVVVHLWDERRLVLPTSWFTTNPFQNWTRNEARVLGSVILHLDYATPLPELRHYAQAVIEGSSLWDRQAWVLQVADTTETTMVVRVLASAQDGPTAWDLRCDIREALLTWLQKNHPQSLPVQRNIGGGHRPDQKRYRDGVVTAEEAGLDGQPAVDRTDGLDRRRIRHEKPVMPDPETAHLDLQTPDHSDEDGEDRADERVPLGEATFSGPEDTPPAETVGPDGSLAGVPAARPERDRAQVGQ